MCPFTNLRRRERAFQFEAGRLKFSWSGHGARVMRLYWEEIQRNTLTCGAFNSKTRRKPPLRLSVRAPQNFSYSTTVKQAKKYDRRKTL